MLKFIIYRVVFPLVYRLGSCRKILPKRVLFIAVRGDQLSNSFRVLRQELEARGVYSLKSLCLKNGSSGQLHYLYSCVKMLWEAAVAKYIFLDEGSNVLGCVPLRKGTVLTQLWHGCGAFKKFGFSIAGSSYGAGQRELEKYPYYRNTTYVTVSSPEVIWAYQEAMGLPQDRIVPVGVSRTDVFYQKAFHENAYEHLRQCMPESTGKKVILYAPTFRGNMQYATAPAGIEWHYLMEALKDNYVVVCKHHPYVKHPPEIPSECSGFVRDLTSQMEIDELMCVSDICISDYSSLIFEYSLLERPMIFLAMDVEAYKDSRGFYYDYEQMTPGPVVGSTQELVEQICEIEQGFDVMQIRAFRQKYMAACDGHATERLMRMVFEAAEDVSGG